MRERLVVPRRRGDRAGEVVHEAEAVRQAGDRVRRDLPLQLELQPLRTRAPSSASSTAASSSTIRASSSSPASPGSASRTASAMRS